jgi:DUF1707 SHOCT-like domain
VAEGPVDPVAAAHGRLRASDADRERVIEALKVAFVRGRLSKDELDRRAVRALTARTYADLAAVTAGVPARPAEARTPDARTPGARTPEARPRARPRSRPRRHRARVQDQPPANTRALKRGLTLATFIVPAVCAAALHSRNEDLFTATIVLLMAYVLTAVIAAANGVASRYENERSGESRGQRSDTTHTR